MQKNIAIAPVQRAQLTEQVIGRIKEYIEANDLRPGAKLPGERELALSLGVSRNVTREAIRALQATGILEIQPGNGIFVAEFGFEALANHFNFVIRSQQHQMRHLVEARLVFESGVLELAANCLKPADVKRLKKAARNIGNATTSEEDMKAELEFHQHLVRVTGNPVLMEFATFFNRFFQEGQTVIGNVFVNVKSQKVDEREHLELIEALQRKDVSGAKVMLEKSIRRWQR
ncbi:MAG: FadR/GntR family transcriptional regulator [Abditibacteriaceae bacterium]